MAAPIRLVTAGAVPLAPGVSPSPLPPARAPAPDGERFASLVARHRAPPAPAPAPPAASVAPPGASLQNAAAPVRNAARPALSELGSGLLSRVARGERLVEQVVRRGARGEAFSPEELLVIQAQVYRASQDLELLSKLVEKGTGAVKTVLQQSG